MSQTEISMNYIKVLLTIFVGLVTSSAIAEGVSLNQSRVVFFQTDKSQFVQIHNDTKNPLLVQSSVIDDVDGNLVDNFLITPPIFKVSAESEFAMRVVPNKVVDLPKDKESVFYIKVRAIPALDKLKNDKDKPGMVFVTAFVIKMFYRPDGIIEPNDEIYESVKLINKDGIWQFNNPTPYYMTIVDLKIKANNQSNSIFIPPFSTYKVVGADNTTQEVSWRFLNDFGAGTKKYSSKSY